VISDAFSLALFRASLFAGAVPVAGLRSQPAKVKAMIAAALAVVLYPAVEADLARAGAHAWISLAGGYAAESLAAAALVIAVNELYAASASVWSVQTGLSYSSVLDPSKEAESTSLTSLVQLFFLLHFTEMNLHLGLLGGALGSPPPDSAAGRDELLGGLARVGSRVLSSGLSWGLPYIVLLASVDVILAIAARVHEKFQPGGVSNPLKQILLLALLLVSLPLWRTETGELLARWLAG
jgi:flagellar biosynthesis protein FliR